MQQSATQSTGPRTAAGKTISSQNALKHGLASGTLFIPGEDPAVFEALLTGFLTDYRPINQIETALVHEIAKAYWLKDRALRFQTIAFEITMPHLEKMAAPMDLGVLIRYQTANERNFYRAIKTLQLIQKERKQFVSQKQERIAKYTAESPESPKSSDEFVSQKPAFDLEDFPSVAELDAKMARMTAALQESELTGEDPFLIEQRIAAKTNPKTA
jgi:hypothetical protein